MTTNDHSSRRFSKPPKIVVVTLVVLVFHLSLVQLLGTSSPYLIARGISMEPTFHEGDLLLAEAVPAGLIEVGDVIAFRVPVEERERLNLPSSVAHRVVEIKARNGAIWFSTAGDNSSRDPFEVSGDSVIGRISQNAGPIAWPIVKLLNRTFMLVVAIPLMMFGLAFGAVLIFGRRDQDGSRESTVEMLHRWVAAVRDDQSPEVKQAAAAHE